MTHNAPGTAKSEVNSRSMLKAPEITQIMIQYDAEANFDFFCVGQVTPYPSNMKSLLSLRTKQMQRATSDQTGDIGGNKSTAML